MTDGASRRRLPDRRPSVTHTINWGGNEFSISIGFWPDNGQPAEVFAAGQKSGSALQMLLADSCVILSVALQCGIEPSALAHSLARVPLSKTQSQPASIIGIIAEVLAQEPGAEKTEATP